MRKWFFSAPKVEKYSRENCELICKQIQAFEVNLDFSPRGVEIIVEAIRSLAEVVLWGDKFHPDTFYTFLESNMMGTFLKIISNTRVPSPVKVQIIQTLTILIQNLTNEASVFTLLSNNTINHIISAHLDFDEEEIISHYISFLKTLSLRLNTQTIQFFFHKEHYYFPLYSECIKFFQHDDRLVRTSVRSVALNVFKVSDVNVRQYIEENGDKFFNQFSWYVNEQFTGLRQAVVRYDFTLFCGVPHDDLLPLPQMSIFTEDLIDDFLFVNDLMELPSAILVERVQKYITEAPLKELFHPGPYDVVRIFLLAQWVNTAVSPTFLRIVLEGALPIVENAMRTTQDTRVLSACLVFLLNVRQNRAIPIEELARLGWDLRSPTVKATACGTSIPPDVLRTPPKNRSLSEAQDAIAASPAPPNVMSPPPDLSSGPVESVIRPGDVSTIVFPAVDEMGNFAEIKKKEEDSEFYNRPHVKSLLAILHRIVRSPQTLRFSCVQIISHLLQELLSAGTKDTFVRLHEEEQEILTRALQSSMAVLRHRLEEHRQALFDMYVTHQRPFSETTCLNTSSLLINLEGSKAREIFDPLELLYIRLHSVYPMYLSIQNTPVGSMLHDPAVMVPSHAPFAPNITQLTWCTPLVCDDEVGGTPPVVVRPETQLPEVLKKVPLPNRCALTLDEMEVVEILAFLTIRKWYCVFMGVPDVIPKVCQRNKARYTSGTEVNTSDLGDKCNMVGVRCQYCPVTAADERDKAAYVAPTAPGTVLYLFLEGDVVLLVEPSTSTLGKGTITFCFPVFFTEAVIDPKFAFKLTLRCESAVHQALCCVVLAFRDTTTAQAVARHVNGASQTVRKKMCADTLKLITVLPE
eukprot:PhF_6_TR43110/c0_g1_i1/m.65885/K19513/CLEC16A; protein CLEC16A